MTTTAPQQRSGTLLPSLTGMRFIAAMIVFLFHSTYELPFANAGMGHASQFVMQKAGPMAVAFFFILSGFILTYTWKPGVPARTFWRRRFARIFPNHAVAWAVALVCLLALGQAVGLDVALPNLLMLHPWIPRVQNMFSMDVVSWSLACEAWFYLAAPLLFLLVNKIAERRLWLWAGVVVVAIFLVPLVANLLPATPMYYTSPVWRVWLVELLPVTRALDFFLGMVLARVIKAGKWPGLGVLPSLGIVVLAYLAGIFVLPVSYGYVAIGTSLALVIGACAAADIKGRRTPFSSNTMVRLGELAFAFYLVHWMVLHFGHLALGPGRTWDTPTAIGLIALAFVISAPLAWLLHTGVERPAEKWISGRRRPAPRPRPTAAPVS
ncbi:acyltransferase [Kutzneria buriramensis]|uniref:Peptidoglycan/LPS O-acetylase OafA/YrhL n=1 Tax=Kutzneria buriramensis TaxID=1045776 RepID=A0A3E0GWQ5_9PSEU|nr:acyltransferase [Kutzneria buriramensis]REH32563.1 peptidoglycan/LPS O-acetylase OafA/YrhL [Kutzneria buriramensis]